MEREEDNFSPTPFELKVHIADYLKPKDLNSFGIVSKEFNTVQQEIKKKFVDNFFKKYNEGFMNDISSLPSLERKIIMAKRAQEIIDFMAP
jgi:hypothetical protein